MTASPHPTLLPVSHQFEPKILRAYDIRGIYGETLTERDAYALGQILAKRVLAEAGGSLNKGVVIGYDGRPSSPTMMAYLAAGFQKGFDGGEDTVTSIGLATSPQVYFAVHHYGYDGGVIVTASHNPGEYNGFKMMVGKKTLSEDDIQSLAQDAANVDMSEFEAIEPSNVPVQSRAILSEYLDELLANTPVTKPMKVAWDTGNGAAGPAVAALIERLPGEHTQLFAEVDGTFPNHHPDPTVEENLKDLSQVVRDQGCDFGIGFDGDGDRIGVIDHEGTMVWGDQLLALFAREVLRETPGAPIIAEVKSSQSFFDDVTAHGGRPVMARVGHSLIKAEMMRQQAPLAGEMSGHIFFADRYFGFDDAVYASLRLLEVLARQDKPLKDRVASLPQYINTPEVRFDCADEDKQPTIAAVTDRVKQGAADADICDIDGVRVTYPDGWWLLRASNTQSVLSARFEAKSQTDLQRLINDCAEHLAACGHRLPIEDL